MKAWGLFLSLVLFCAGCATSPEPGLQPDRYGGPPLADAPNFDRASVDLIGGPFTEGRRPDRNTAAFASYDVESTLRAGKTRAECAS